MSMEAKLQDLVLEYGQLSADVERTYYEEGLTSTDRAEIRGRKSVVEANLIRLLTCVNTMAKDDKNITEARPLRYIGQRAMREVFGEYNEVRK